jgi:predicted metal-binding membrane protein
LSTPETVASRDRVAVFASLFGLAAVAWIVLTVLVQRMMAGSPMADMPGMETMAMPMPALPWSAGDFAETFAMWWVMMAAMMLPSASPMVAAVAAINRSKHARGQASVPSGIFTAGYLLAWGAFSAAATAAQWGLDEASLLLGGIQRLSPLVAGGLLVAVGAYQFTPLKRVCLSNCRSPMSFVMNHWRNGTGGALAMGFAHGIYCLGCCWLLMGLLFVGGVMSLLWAAAVALLVFVEKLLPGGALIARAGGLAIIAYGLYLLVRAAGA